jgi:hypothetical protein
MSASAKQVVAKFKAKKEVDSLDGGKTTVYLYSDRQIAKRNNDKAKRIEALRGRIGDLRKQVAKDLKSSDPETFLTALAVGLMDDTAERVGNDGSADDGHFGVTGWEKSHISFGKGKGKATIRYIGKSGVKHKKVVESAPLVKALRDAYEAAEGDDACLFCHEGGKVTADKVNAYLKPFKISAKDIRGLHANTSMQRNLKLVRKGALPEDAKERKAKLKEEFQKALELTAEEIGHESATLRSQYLTPAMETSFMQDGTILDKLDKKTAAYPFEPQIPTERPKHYRNTCPSCGIVSICRCPRMVHDITPQVVTNDLCYECRHPEGFKLAGIKRLDLDWVEGLRKDFLALLKNLPKVKDYKTAHILRDAFKIYRANFDELMFERFLNNGLKYDFGFDTDTAERLDKKLRKIIWDFSVELNVPIDFANEYRSEGMLFQRFLEEYPKWKSRVQAKARIFWTEMKDVLGWVQSQGKPGLDVQVLDKEQTVLEGFRLTMIGYDPSDKYKSEELAQLKEGLRLYRNNASKTFPWLLKNQLPVEVVFEDSLDKGGEYHLQGKITLFASSIRGKGVKWVCHVMAHEMGHHLYKNLDGSAQDFWNTAIKGDYGDLDVQKLLDKWPGNIWAFEFPEKFGLVDPLLSLQVDAISHDSSYSRGKEELQSKEDFQRLLNQGVKTLRVPQTPITGYANTNPEEAMCEAIGLLVTYGPRAVHEKIRGWLHIVVPGEIRLASIASVVTKYLEGKVR